MSSHPLAGKPAPRSILVNIPKLVSEYFTEEASGRVSFGTSGHRGSSVEGTFNEPHIAAIAQAVSEYRRGQHTTGPLFMGCDTHALSEPCFRTALEVLNANGVNVLVHEGGEYTPTPVISYLILDHNHGRAGDLADGVVITPSHNPPRDGGFKYNPPHGGPADVAVTGWIEQRANQLLDEENREVRRIPYPRARRSELTRERDFMTPFIATLAQVVDMDAIKASGIRLGVDPMGGSSVNFWEPIAERYGLDLHVVNPVVDPTFGFMTVDQDGEIRMDCSSPYAMAGLISLADQFDLAWGNDTDCDRHGIVCPSGLMNPNHYLAVAVWYLMQHRPGWEQPVTVGKTLVSSSMIDRVVAGLGGRLYEVPVGFKWFVEGLLNGRLAFGGEESAGAAFLKMDGRTWCTDKDGFSLDLLAAEISAKCGRGPDEIYRETLVPKYGDPYYKRADGPVTDEQKTILKGLEPNSFGAKRVAGQPVEAVLTRAPGNDAPIGGLKVVLRDGSWFAMRPSGTEPKIKVYVESFGGKRLWQKIYEEAHHLVFGSEP